MKTYCKPKNVNIEDMSFNLPAVIKCLKGADGNPSKLGRMDFRSFLSDIGTVTRKELEAEHRTKIYNKTNQAIEEAAEALTQDIRERNLRMMPVRQFRRKDGLSGKERNICQESPRQQVHEYILVNALTPLFRAKFLPSQYGSIPGRGPELGKRKIERILRKCCKYGKTDVIQGDIKKAYPSTTTELVMALLRRDIRKNHVLIWYAEAVMANYPGGVLLIGGYFSSYAFNYVMSYVLRYIMSQEKVRRGVRQKLVRAVVCYADDFIIFGHISQIKKVMKKVSKWVKVTFGIAVKDCWKILRMPGFQQEKECREHRLAGSKRRTVGIDMIGYVVRGTYTIIRKRIFKRLRRQFLRAGRELASLGYVPHWRARKLTSYKGRIKCSDSRKLTRLYNVNTIMYAAQKSISWYAKKGAKKHETAVCSTA